MNEKGLQTFGVAASILVVLSMVAMTSAGTVSAAVEYRTTTSETGRLDQIAIQDVDTGLEEGDLVVSGDINGEPEGVIWRIRDGEAAVFCQSDKPEPGGQSEVWNIPDAVAVDSHGRVVFTAWIPSFRNRLLADTVGPIRGFGLFRCNAMGERAEVLGLFPWNEVPDPENAGGPLPFGEELIHLTERPGGQSRVPGLHLARQAAVVIDDDVNGGEPQITFRDRYVFGVLDKDEEEMFILSYNPERREFDEGPEVIQNPAWRRPHLPNMVNYRGFTYSAVREEVGRADEKTNIEISGTSDDVEFDLQLRISQFHVIAKSAADRTVVDDLDIPNPEDNPCVGPPPPPPPVDYPFDPPGFKVVSGLTNIIVHDGKPVVSSAVGSFGEKNIGYITNLDALVEQGPGFWMGENVYVHPNSCEVVPRAKLDPLTNPDMGFNLATDLTSSKEHGVVATRTHHLVPDQVVRLTGDDFEPLITSDDDDRLRTLIAVAAYEPDVPTPPGGSVIVRVDSPVDVLVTDPDGRQLGVDPATGDPVNDFGDAALDTGPGEPRVFVIEDPTLGEYEVQAVGTNTGEFTIHIYGADLDETTGGVIRASGEAAPGATTHHNFSLAEGGAVTFIDGNQPPVADAGGPYTVDEGDSIQLDGTNSSDPDGDDLTFAWDLDGDGTTDSSDPMPTFDATALDGPTTVTGSLTVCDPSDACDTQSVTITVENVAPDLGVTLDDPVDEGSPLNLTATITDPGLADTHTLVIEWGDGENDTVPVDQHAAASTVTVEHMFLDDGEYIVTVHVTDDDGGTDDAEVTVTVVNVPPTVSASGDSIDEGQTATISAEFTDPGLADTHTAEIDWGDGITETVAVDQGAGEGSIEATHTYGDDGEYTVTVHVTDDGDTGTDTAVVQVANLAPDLTLDSSNAITLPSGEKAVLGGAGQTQSFSAEATDPGSDDLTFTWSVGIETTYFNDGTNPDPDLSPGGTFPFIATDTASATSADLGVHGVGVTVTDDDGGSDETELATLVTGDADDVRGMGFWRQQYSGKGKVHFSDPELGAFLAISEHASGVFSEGTTVDTFDAAHDALSPSGPEMREKAEAQALAAWLNFAAGGVGWNDEIDTDCDGEADRAFHDVIGEVESILADSDASKADLERAKDLAEAINDVGGDAVTTGDGNGGGQLGNGKNG